MPQARPYTSEFLCILRAVYCWALAICGLLLCYLFIVILSPLLKVFYTCDDILSLWAKSVLGLANVTVSLRGLEKLYKEGSYILVSNHESILDILIFQAVMPSHAHLIWIGKKSLFSIPIVGRIMRTAAYIPIDRSSGMQAYKTIYKAIKANQEMKTKKSVFIMFPEGRRASGKGELAPFKSGAFLLALRTKLPIQAVSIQGSGKLLPVQKNRWIQRIFPGNVNFTVHPCIYPEEYAHKSAQELSDLLRQMIASVLVPKEELGEAKTKELICPRSSGDRALVS